MTEQKVEQFWRDAKAADIAKVMKGETVEARFRDIALRDWKFGHLNGWADGEFRCDLAMCWVHCQVYDPPQWWLDKPDLGEGYRLLEKFPDEPVRGGDFIYGSDGVWVELRNECNPTQGMGLWYRRRIEPEKVTSRSKDYIPSGWIKVPNDEPRLASDAYWSQGASEWCLIGDNRVEYANRDKWPAIRQVNSYISLMSAPTAYEWVTSVGDRVRLPNGKQLGVTKQGFEVL